MAFEAVDRKQSAMTDLPAPGRVEPIMDPGPVPAGASYSAPEPRPSTDLAFGEQLAVRPAASSVQALAANGGGSAEQLARVEEKVARIEEKLARFEANNQRVVDRFELASARMSEVAQQGELAAVKAEVAFIARRAKNLPGLTALVACAIVTAILTAALTALVLRYLPGFLPR